MTLQKKKLVNFKIYHQKVSKATRRKKNTKMVIKIINNNNKQRASSDL